MVASALLLPGAGRAAHPLVSDDTGTQGDRRYAVEVGAGWATDRADGTLTQGGSTAAVLSFGAAERVDLVLGVPAAWNRTRLGGALVDESAGASDATLELKWRLLDAGPFSLAVKPGLTLPTGDARRGLGAGSMGYALTLIASHVLGPATLHLNAGLCHNEHALVDDRGTMRHVTAHASVAAVVAVAPRVQVVANVGLQSPPTTDDPTWPAFALAGAIYAVGESVTVDAGVRTALNDADTDLALLAGASWRF